MCFSGYHKRVYAHMFRAAVETDAPSGGDGGKFIVAGTRELRYRWRGYCCWESLRIWNKCLNALPPTLTLRGGRFLGTAAPRQAVNQAIPVRPTVGLPYLQRQQTKPFIQDIPGGVMVPVMFGSAGWAHPLADVERLHLHLSMPAARAQLARWKGAVDTDHRPPVPFRFFCMFCTRKSSTHTTWFSRMRRVDSLCRKSFRQLAIFSWSLATHPPTYAHAWKWGSSRREMIKRLLTGAWTIPA